MILDIFTLQSIKKCFVDETPATNKFMRISFRVSLWFTLFLIQRNLLILTKSVSSMKQ